MTRHTQHIRILPPILLVALLLLGGCAPGDSTPPPVGDDDDAAADDDDATSGDDDDAADDDDSTSDDDDSASDDDDATDGVVDTIDEYLQVYCGEYAVDCGLYVDVATCVDTVWESWFSTCEVVDAVALNSCAEWIAGISCSEQSWLDDCDLAVECD